MGPGTDKGCLAAAFVWPLGDRLGPWQWVGRTVPTDRVGNGQTDDRGAAVGLRDRYGCRSTRADPINGLFLLGSFQCGVDAICRGA